MRAYCNYGPYSHPRAPQRYPRTASIACALFHLKHQDECGPVFCRWCGDYVPLGESNDRPLHVQHEIALAAALADYRYATEAARDGRMRSLEEAYAWKRGGR